jgi:ribosomal protein S18 acetylase RimI-like enzyme
LNRTATISDVTEEDLPGVRPLIAELISALDDRSGFDVDRAMKNCLALLGRSEHALLAARTAGTVCGFLHLAIRQGILHDRPVGLIDELVVGREFRGQGVGRLLMDAAIDRCRDLGCCEVEVSTERANLRAQEFYRRCGFDEEGVLFELHFSEGRGAV